MMHGLRCFPRPTMKFIGRSGRVKQGGCRVDSDDGRVEDDPAMGTRGIIAKENSMPLTLRDRSAGMESWLWR